MLEAKPLQGLHILVTRPAHQAGAFQKLIEQAGAQAHLIPLIAIEALALNADLVQKLQTPKAYQLIIFISANAVEQGLKVLPKTLLNQAQIGAIGQATAMTLQQHQINAQLVADKGFTSENFLALPAIQNLSNQQILIVRGLGGRELLAEQLKQRGAHVAYANVYKRFCPPDALERLKQLHQSLTLDIIALTSSEGLHALHRALSSTTKAWQHIPLLLGSQRTAVEAQALGFKHWIMAENPSDAAMVAALMRWQGL